MPKRRTSRYATSAPVSRPRVARRCVSAGSSPAGACLSDPVMRRWTTRVRPLVSRQSRYLPRRSTAATCSPTSASATSPGSTGARQPRVDDLGMRDRRALEQRREPTAHGLDLGQLGHRRIVGPPVVRVRPARRPASLVLAPRCKSAGTVAGLDRPLGAARGGPGALRFPPARAAARPTPCLREGRPPPSPRGVVSTCRPPDPW